MNNIIVMFDNRDEVIEMSLYEFMDIQIRRNIPFAVCNVSLKDFKELTKQVYMGYLQERIPRLDLNRKPYNNRRYIAGHGKGNKVILLSDPDENVKGRYLVVDGVLRHNLEEEITTEDIYNAFSKGIKIYTTESVEDIINHYILMDIEKVDVDELSKEEVELKLRALYEQLFKLNRAKDKLLDRKEKIERAEETPADYFIKYSK